MSQHHKLNRQRRSKSTDFVQKDKLAAALNEFEQERNNLLGWTPEDRKASREAGLKDPRLSEYIGYAILNIARNYSERRSFYRMPQAAKDDMVSCGVLNACIYIQKSYDSSRSETNNPFSFITYCVWSGVTAYFKKERQNTERTNSYIEALQTGQIILPEMESPDGTQLSISSLMDMIDQIGKDQEESPE